MMLTFSLSEVAGLLVAAVCLTSWFVPRLSKTKKANLFVDTAILSQIVADVSKLIADVTPHANEPESKDEIATDTHGGAFWNHLMFVRLLSALQSNHLID